MSRVVFRFYSSAVMAAFVAASSSAVLAAPSFQGLGDLPGGSTASVASAVSADGATVVGMSTSARGQQAYRWTAATGMIGLGPLGVGFNSHGFDVSADGSVVVGYGNPGARREAFRWTTSSGATFLGDLSGGDTDSQALGVSADGSVVVGYGRAANGQRAVRWTELGGLVDLGTLTGYSSSIALHTSGDGSVVVGASRTYVPDLADYEGEAYRWTQAGGMQALGHLPGREAYSQANAVSADGSVVVGVSSLARRLGTSGGVPSAFLWTEAGGMSGLGTLAGDDASTARSVSADGSMVVGRSYDVATSDSRAFLWDADSGMRNLQHMLTSAGLDLAGWQLTGATGITVHDGQLILVGDGINPLGDREAWVATIPEPSTLALLAVGGVLLAAARRKGRSIN